MGLGEGRYGFIERVVMGLASQALSAPVTKHFATIFSKACHKGTGKLTMLIK